MYFVYVLKSSIADKSYAGYTSNVQIRLAQHNSGETKYTRIYKPWIIIHTESYSTQKDALDREKYLKSKMGRRWLKENLFN